MRKILLSIGIVFASIAGYAQQDPQFTHFMFDRLSINPGYAGSNQAICATGIFRQQWTGFDGAPQSILFNVHAPVKLLRGGVGLTFFNDKLGFEQNNILRLSYAYRKSLGPGTLGAGVQLGIVSKNIKPSWVSIDDYTLDPSIPNGNTSETVFDMGLGVYYSTNQLYMGISTTHLTKSDLNAINIEMARHYYIMAGYKYDINGDWTLKPAILAKSDAASTQLDLNVTVLYKNMVWAGASYRFADAIAPMVGYQKEIGKGMMKIGYSYDVTTSEIKNFSSGSHEIFLNYCFNIEQPPAIQKYKNVRFL